MTRKEVYGHCQTIAPQYGFEPLLILAVCEKESNYEHSEARLEQGFYRKYTRPKNLSTTTEILLSSSYGLMQVMGESLRQMGYFSRYKEEFDAKYLNNKECLSYFGFQHDSENELHHLMVTKAIDEFMINPEKQIEYGCKWLDVKRTVCKSKDIKKILSYYNGDIKGINNYAESVLLIYYKLKNLKTI